MPRKRSRAARPDPAAAPKPGLTRRGALAAVAAALAVPVVAGTQRPASPVLPGKRPRWIGHW